MEDDYVLGYSFFLCFEIERYECQKSMKKEDVRLLEEVNFSCPSIHVHTFYGHRYVGYEYRSWSWIIWSWVPSNIPIISTTFRSCALVPVYRYLYFDTCFLFVDKIKYIHILHTSYISDLPT